ncbi:MAG: DUF5654 family protein [Patescibacteria group bacterium]|nr:DUF5654 family protein [Patescibacteria group bacterium]
MIDNNKLEKIRKESKKIKGEVKEKTLGFILTAFGLVAGLAWNEAIQSLIKSFFTVDKDSIWVKFLYAIVMTLVVVVVTVYLTRLFGKDEEEKK